MAQQQITEVIARSASSEVKETQEVDSVGVSSELAAEARKWTEPEPNQTQEEEQRGSVDMRFDRD